MKNTKLKRFVKVVSAVGVVSMVMGVFGHGCGNLKSSGGSSNTSLGGGSCKSTGFSEISVAPGKSTVSLLYGGTVLEQFAACTGLSGSDVKDKTVAEFEARKNAFSEYGSALDVTAPMLMGSLAVAGEVCDDVVDREMGKPDVQATQNNPNSGRAVFVGWGNFSGNGCPSEAVVDETIARMAFSCWAVKESDLNIGNQQLTYAQAVQQAFSSEMAELKGGLDLVGGDRRTCAITLCSAMLASLRGLVATP